MTSSKPQLIRNDHPIVLLQSFKGSALRCLNSNFPFDETILQRSK